MPIREPEDLLALSRATQPWIDGWQAGRVELALGAESVAWLRSLAPSVLPLAWRFPPASLVMARVELRIPFPGTCGIVSGYREPTPRFPRGLVIVRQSPDDEERAPCEPDNLASVGYFRGMTPRFVMDLIAAGLAAPS